MTDVSIIRVESIGSKHKPRVIKERRVCTEDGCTTVLSIYNTGPRCSIHTEPTYVRTRGRA